MASDFITAVPVSPAVEGGLADSELLLTGLGDGGPPGESPEEATAVLSMCRAATSAESYRQYYFRGTRASRGD